MDSGSTPATVIAGPKNVATFVDRPLAVHQRADWPAGVHGEFLLRVVIYARWQI